jgi:hypothetical protein
MFNVLPASRLSTAYVRSEISNLPSEIKRSVAFNVRLFSHPSDRRPLDPCQAAIPAVRPLSTVT